MIEIWKDIKGYEGLYQVSNQGRIKSMTRKDSLGRERIEKILKLNKLKNGYMTIMLCKEGITNVFLVHRLVAEAFIPNPYNLPQVNHISEDKTENTVLNLEWVTRSDNQKWSKSRNVNQYTLDGVFVKCWKSLSDIRDNLGFQTGHIAQCCKHKKHCNTAYNYRWEYADNNKEIE